VLGAYGRAEAVVFGRREGDVRGGIEAIATAADEARTVAEAAQTAV
jgi:hypothetical protein